MLWFLIVIVAVLTLKLRALQRELVELRELRAEANLRRRYVDESWLGYRCPVCGNINDNLDDDYECNYCGVIPEKGKYTRVPIKMSAFYPPKGLYEI